MKQILAQRDRVKEFPTGSNFGWLMLCVSWLAFSGIVVACQTNAESAASSGKVANPENVKQKTEEQETKKPETKKPETKKPRDDVAEATNQTLQMTNLELASKTVRASTVTIRVDRVCNQDENGVKLQKPRRDVAVFSGVLVKKRYVATPLFLPNCENPEVRITLPDGKQTIGKPKLLDEYSGLAILEIDDVTVPCLKLCERSKPTVGSWIVSGAAWGRKEALVSIGIVSGVGYRLPNAEVEPPPMIVCDLRAAQTSKGSGIVAADCKLVGIVMAVSPDNRWTYAVPASHINRLLRSLRQHQQSEEFKDDEILVLKRQVPHVGIRVDSQWNKEKKSYDCMVVSTRDDGPAALAGMKPGDQIVDVNGEAVRNHYDVFRDISHRQPGDRIQFGIKREGDEKQISVVLGGGFAASGKTILRLKELITPEIDLSPTATTGDVNQHLKIYSQQNLTPPCVMDKTVRDLIDRLSTEKSQNEKLQAKVDQLEAKLNQVLELMNEK